MFFRNRHGKSELVKSHLPVPSPPFRCKPNGQETVYTVSHTVHSDRSPALAYQVQAGGARLRGDAPASQVGQEPTLGTPAKSSPTCDPETGEIFQAETFNPMAARLERFAMQSAARSVLPGHRVGCCLRRRQGGKDVEVWKAAGTGAAHYKKLQTCGSVWVCPICAAKISEKRRAELVSAVATHKAQGGAVLLLTLTNPHERGNKLSDLLEGQTQAFTRFLKGRVWDLLANRIGLVGHVRAWEVTHGVNGWHPHFHVLLFVREGLDLASLHRDLLARWQSCCEKAGLHRPSDAHGIRLDDGTHAARYAAKWGIEQEMTKGHIAKKAKSGGSSPFDLLRRVLADRSDKQAAFLFREFAEAFHGRRQLVWSKGLKDRFSIQAVADELIAEGGDEESVRLGVLSVEDWRRVLWVEGRSIVLELARHGWPAVELYLGGLRRSLGDLGQALEDDGEGEPGCDRRARRGAPSQASDVLGPPPVITGATDLVARLMHPSGIDV